MLSRPGSPVAALIIGGVAASAGAAVWLGAGAATSGGVLTGAGVVGLGTTTGGKFWPLRLKGSGVGEAANPSPPDDPSSPKRTVGAPEPSPVDGGGNTDVVVRLELSGNDAGLAEAGAAGAGMPAWKAP